MQKRRGKMHLFKSREPNLVHYATVVTHNRVPVFRNDHALLASCRCRGHDAIKGTIQADRSCSNA